MLISLSFRLQIARKSHIPRAPATNTSVTSTKSSPPGISNQSSNPEYSAIADVNQETQRGPKRELDSTSSSTAGGGRDSSLLIAYDGRETGVISSSSTPSCGQALPMSLLHQLRRAPSTHSSPCRVSRSGKRVVRALSSNATSVDATAQSRARPRVVFSGIQPTGIPHVRTGCALYKSSRAHGFYRSLETS